MENEAELTSSSAEVVGITISAESRHSILSILELSLTIAQTTEKL